MILETMHQSVQQSQPVEGSGLDVPDFANERHFHNNYRIHLLGQKKIYSFPHSTLSKKYRTLPLGK